ncbi:uncharacterized protein LOC119346113 [Triticum dicoccoides]|uniref:uncharacterized protein LOC119346113 n=1 Tax=Triticum dicoccoides TaxID=85692 RepID=UPI00188E9D41|nr:uncharacterized protein LOC119346113 [Triticum dicoccoides]
MHVLEHIRIQAKNIDAAAEKIIGVLEDTSKGNIIYIHGWSGFGASVALKVVAQHLKSSKSKFDKVIHVDCSVWQSMRAQQKAVAEELELPQSVLAICVRPGGIRAPAGKPCVHCSSSSTFVRVRGEVARGFRFQQLELPQSVMAIFDLCDEDDDFNGIKQGSRGVIADVGREICTKLLNSRFAVVFHNGSRRYIDLYECAAKRAHFSNIA